ncbi:diguanylate cyclase domain-containing protein [Niallia sp. NCCP-28]|uniref:sensor domain-containing protein n=1 Tax=Niallia sp. NCCP-28 TaxID=2934712 RepID=UPI0020840DA1|nr:diguanylate cyclase [Niallia sp. NCCP-28]GKU83122.1 hypothetical protein NCCP28_25180 [Niallia sp. NCCP-28]
MIEKNPPNQKYEDIDRFRALVEHVSDWIWEVDHNGIYTYASPRVKDMLGYEPEEVIGKTPFDLMPEWEAKRIAPIFEELLSQKLPIKSLENINIHRDGHEVILETSGSPIIDSRGICIGYRGMDRDITSRKAAERKQQQLLDIIKESPDFIATIDLLGHVTFLNTTAKTILGLKESPQLSIESFHPKWASDLIIQEAFPTSIKTGVWKGETIIITKAGREMPVSQIMIAHKSSQGEVEYFSTIARDITERVELEKLIKKKAYLDELTNLPNRRFLHDELTKYIEGKKKFALLFVDIDNFKIINDTYGHHNGDLALSAISQRLSISVRKEDFVCRYGGDEFIILLRNIEESAQIQQLADRVLSIFQKPFSIQSENFIVTASIGISIYPTHGHTVDALITNADKYMYEIKKHGKNDYQIGDAL